jgi:hypothetical protein
VVQGLTHTIGLDAPRVRVLDTLRRLRNVSDYTGEDIADSSVEQCIAEAERLQVDVTNWLREHASALLAP